MINPSELNTITRMFLTEASRAFGSEAFSLRVVNGTAGVWFRSRRDGPPPVGPSSAGTVHVHHALGRNGKADEEPPGAGAEVNDILVLLGDQEISIQVGTYFHTHFLVVVKEGQPQDEAEASAVRKAVSFIRDFIDGKSFLVINYCGKIPVNASVSGGDRVVPLGTRFFFARFFSLWRSRKYYRWAGSPTPRTG